MSSKIVFNFCALFGAHRKHTCQVRLNSSLASIQLAQKTHMLSKNDLSHSILRAQKTHVLSEIASSLTLDSARTENVHVKYDCLKTYNLFSTQRKHTYQARLTSSLALYSASAEDSYVKQDFLQVLRFICRA